MFNLNLLVAVCQVQQTALSHSFEINEPFLSAFRPSTFSENPEIVQLADVLKR